MTQVFRLICTALLCSLVGGAAFAQSYPTKSITLVVPFAAGGPTDTVARTIAVAMQKRLRQTIIIENVGGAGGTIGARRVSEAEPDGYTVLLHHIGMATSPALYPNLGFDPQVDFEPIGEVTDVPMTLIGRADLPAKDVKSLLPYLKANRDKLTYAHAGAGSASHLCGLLLMNTIGIDLKTISYKGTGPAMHELLSGNVDLMCDQTTNTTAQIRAGKVIAYGITAGVRAPTLPDVPSLHTAGLKNFEVAVWHGLYVPKRTPKDVIAKLTDALQGALEDQAVVARLNDLGTEPVPREQASPYYARGHLAAEIMKWGPIIEKARKYAD